MNSRSNPRRWPIFLLGLTLAGLALPAGPQAASSSSARPPHRYEREIRGIEALHEDGRYPEAYERSLDLLKRVEKSAGLESLELAAVLDKVAWEQASSVRLPWELAEARVRRALRIKERLLGESDPRVAESLLVLGRVLLWRLSLKEALETFQRVIAIRTIAWGPESAEVAEALTWSGIARIWLDDPAVVADLKRALSTLEKMGTGDMGTVLLHLAKVSLGEGRYEEAKEYALASLRDYERRLRPDQPSSNPRAERILSF